MSWKFIQGQLLSSSMKKLRKKREKRRESGRETGKYFMAIREGEKWMIPA